MLGDESLWPLLSGYLATIPSNGAHAIEGDLIFIANGLTGAPEEIRTPDPQIRSLVLYPVRRCDSAFATSNAQNEIVPTDFVRQCSGQPRLFPTSRVRHRGDEPRDDALDRVRQPTRR